MSSSELPKVAVAEHLAQKIYALDAAHLPQAVRAKCEELLIDVVGLAVTARNEDYVKAVLAACDDDGPCTAIGHTRTLSAVAAALVNGTAIHGEDFDDTFEGGPVHAGAVVVPAVLAACERLALDGRAALLGIAVGVETMCRLSTVAPTLTHKAGFHPTAIFGAMGAAAGVGAALKLSPRQMVDAFGTVGSMASGIIEYQAAACRLGGAIGHPRGAAWPRRILRPAHGV
jgi:2-methylcitrate dehydratase PrpD